MRMKDQHEMSMVVRKPSRGTSTTRPPSVSLGENAMEWTTKSSAPHSLAMRSNTASICPGVRTSNGIRIGASSSLRQRLDVFLRLVVQIRDGELRAEGAERGGAAPCDRLLVGDADDEALLAFEQFSFDNRDHRNALSFSRRRFSDPDAFAVPVFSTVTFGDGTSVGPVSTPNSRAMRCNLAAASPAVSPAALSTWRSAAKALRRASPSDGSRSGMAASVASSIDQQHEVLLAHECLELGQRQARPVDPATARRPRTAARPRSSTPPRAMPT